jgi:hypothetical protein
VAVAKCRLFVVLARDAPRAVIFRRGPSTHVMLALWHTDTDRVEEGQWLKGRIYERRADLSPDGTKLIYFAAQWRRSDVPTWTAISTPPWLSAHVLWPKGDAWGGGGLFEANDAVALNHPYGDLKLDPSSTLPPKLRVREMQLFGAGGEDFPLFGMRLQRDGWRVVSRGAYARTRPLEKSLELQMRIVGMNERGGDWYVVEHRVVDGDEVLLDLGRTEWADWDRSGDLLFARAGVLFRLRRRDGLDLGKAREVIDLRDRKFEAREAPPHAKTWRWRR